MAASVLGHKLQHRGLLGQHAQAGRDRVLHPTKRHQLPAHISSASSSDAAPPASGGDLTPRAPAPEPQVAPSDHGPTPALSAPEDKPGLLQRIKNYFGQGKLEKERLASMGMGAFASYSMISNATYGTCLAIAWIAFVKATGKSPLAPGEWKPFLAFYAGLWTIQNFVRPLRIALAVAMAPAVERAIKWIAERTRLNTAWAFTTLLVSIAATTTVTLFGALALLGGFPDGIPFFSAQHA